jgi:antitoxin HicB
MMKYPARFKRDGNGYTIKFIDLPNAFTQGDTMEELLFNAQDVLSLILGYRLEENKEIPMPSTKSRGKNVVYVEPFPEIILPLEIRKIRNELGKSQSEIAEKMKIPYQTYQRWERAQKFNPTIKTLERIAKALGKQLVIELR